LLARDFWYLSLDSKVRKKEKEGGNGKDKSTCLSFYRLLRKRGQREKRKGISEGKRLKKKKVTFSF
jgi:hypothetical protein